MRRIVLVMLLGLVSVAGLAAASTGDEACWDLWERGANERCAAEIEQAPDVTVVGGVESGDPEPVPEIAVTCREVAVELVISRRLPCLR